MRPPSYGADGTAGALFPLNPVRLLVSGILETPVRAAAWLSAMLGRDREAVEQVLRGRILGGSAGWRVGRDVAFVGPCARFRLGRDVTLYGRSYINANGPEGHVVIGPHTHLDQYCVIYGQGGVTIGEECAIASGVIIYSQTNAERPGDSSPVTRQPTRYAPVEIGAGSWLGAGVRVVPGVRIGAGTHVGAGAVVLNDLESNCVAVGVPARQLRRRG